MAGEQVQQLVSDLGISVFDNGRIGLDGFRLSALFRSAGASAGTDAVVAFRHAAY